ncbi:MAG: hypothetical protein JWR38_3669 [Mucilaginibacter sp.]|nr:hypothetical protein [Mucilaginibacter sp.]
MFFTSHMCYLELFLIMRLLDYGIKGVRTKDRSCLFYRHLNLLVIERSVAIPDGQSE